MSMTDDFDGYLFRAIEEEHLAEVLTHGISGERMTYWATPDIAAYYAETIEDEGKRAFFIVAPLSAFDVDAIEPDMPGIEEPICTIIGLKENEICRRWCASDGSWRACLDLIGSVAYHGSIPKSALLTAFEENYAPLIGTIASTVPEVRGCDADLPPVPAEFAIKSKGLLSGDLRA